MVNLHHLALRTRDVPGLTAFYRTWFGFEVVREQLPRAVWLGLAGDAVLMIEQSAPDEPPLAAGSLELVAFRVAPAERLALRERLVAAGLLETETAHTLYFRDPDGRRLGASSYAFS
jgi:catechol 2,3-dioxygenase-like lactoylglutathione lyase family enzyme